MRVVIYPEALYLSDIIIKDSKIVQGWVENGCWLYKVNLETNRSEAHDTRYKPEQLVNSWKHKNPERIVYVPPEIYYVNDYQGVMDWAINKEHITESLQDLHDIDEIAKINQRPKYEEDDDDIPF